MSANTLTTPGAAPPVVSSPFLGGLRRTWLYRFILFPIGQMIGFIAGVSILLTVLAYVLAFFVPEPREGIVLADQISKQLPGMIISGISIGYVYSMIALGYTLVYGVLKFINFAHSEIFMVGSVIGFEVITRIAAAASLNVWNPVLLILVIVVSAMLFSGTLAVVVERVAYRPLRGAPRLVPLITAIGVSFVLIDGTRALMAITRNDFNLTYPITEEQTPWLTTPINIVINGVAVGGSNIGGTTYETITADGVEYESFYVDGVLHEQFYLGGVTLGGNDMRANQLGVVLAGTEIPTDGSAPDTERPREALVAGQDLREVQRVANVVNVRITSIIIVISAVLMLLALNYFVNGTKLGRGIRAVSQDQATAGLMGVNVNRMISLTFFLGGAFGGAAGALYGLNVGTVTPYVGFIPGLKAFTAAVLGGIGNVTGALLGGLTLGLIESFLNGILVYFPALGQRYTDVFAFSVLILILIFRPSGILGERVDEKV
jgi:branched-subunit amino acid ABC-type transport system permease component